MIRIIIILLFIPVLSFSQLKGNIEAGYIDYQTLIENEGFTRKYSLPSPSFYIDINASYRCKLLQFNQRICNIFTNSANSFSFSPLEITFESELKIYITEKIQIGASHYCQHPIIDTKSTINKYIRSSGNKIFLNIEFRK